MTEFQQFLPNLLLIYLAYLLATASPGPANLAIMTTSMRRGRKTGLTFALGVVTGSITWAALAVSGLTELLKVYTNALVYIKVAGALYLLWMAYKSIASALSETVAVTTIKVNQYSFINLYLQGLALHLTNPKAALGWLAIVSIGVQETTPVWVVVSIFIGCALLGIIIFLGYAMIFSSRLMIARYEKIRRPLEGLMAAVFAYTGLKLFQSIPE